MFAWGARPNLAARLWSCWMSKKRAPNSRHQVPRLSNASNMLSALTHWLLLWSSAARPPRPVSRGSTIRRTVRRGHPMMHRSDHAVLWRTKLVRQQRNSKVNRGASAATAEAQQAPAPQPAPPPKPAIIYRSIDGSGNNLTNIQTERSWGRFHADRYGLFQRPRIGHPYGSAQLPHHHQSGCGRQW